MSVARVGRVFVGGVWDRHDLRASEIRTDVAQGPVPAYLLKRMPDEEVRLRLHKPPKPAPFANMSPEERREKARKGGIAAHRKTESPAEVQPEPAEVSPEPQAARPMRPNRYPCPECGGRSLSRGSAAGGGHWRQCRDCRKNFRTVPRPPRPEYPACRHCGGRSVRNGVLPDGRMVLKCTVCRRSFRPVAKPRVRTHCPSGHEFTAANTGYTSKGFRRCRTCSRERSRARRVRRGRRQPVRFSPDSARKAAATRWAKEGR